MIWAPFKFFSKAAVLLVMASMLNGCSPTGVGATAGIAALEERRVEDVAYDLKLKIKIAKKWLDYDGSLLLDAGIEVYEGRVLLTGNVDTPEIRAAAVRLTWEVRGVKEVINEILVAIESGIMDKARDIWISTQLKTKLTLDKKVYAINYTIKTVARIVYVIGAAQSKEELGRVISHARNINYVRKVINHVRVKGGV
ncbi:MAG TPA: BON domain-containing protein [Rhodospirillales bacterium]|nr:BON domain-containing protein [Rhodospirillales bacterium]